MTFELHAALPGLLAALPGVAAGILLMALVAHLRLRALRQRDAREQELALAVMRGEAESASQAAAELRARIDTLECSLQQSRISEATLSTEKSSLGRQLESLEARLADATRAAEELRSDNTRYREQASRLQTSLAEQEKQNREKLELLEQARKSLNTEFRNLANEIFDAKQRSFREQSHAQLDGLLRPLSEKIRDFEKRVETTYSEESKERFSLIREVRSLQELNARISKDAVNLTNALKGENKTQGTWGEVILERVLERSGLEKGREYETQVSLRTDDGKRLQPDVVVHLPENRDVVIDAKVSLVAYERYHSAGDETAAAEALKSHIQSIRQHVKQLADKEYQGLLKLQTLDFVLLFVPVEAAFAVAVQHDTDLFGDAFERNVMVVSPSTLLATLRMIHNIWRFEQQNRNAQEIARRAGALYDKFVGFVADLEEVGDKLGTVQAAYDRAHNKLSSGKGNLVGRAEAMKALGAKVNKSLPEHLVRENAVAETAENLVEIPFRDRTSR